MSKRQNLPQTPEQARQSRSTRGGLQLEEPTRVERSSPKQRFRDSELYRMWAENVVESDNDFIVVIAAASKSAVSGVGKTTLGITLARYCDQSTPGFDAEKKATLSAEEFAKELLTDRERVPNKSSIIFDEAQGTLSDHGTDARRSMAQSVMDVTTALSTMRFRQNTAIIISQSTKWIDKRIDDVLDALVLIQPQSAAGMVRAEVFDTYYNDLQTSNSTRYTERVDTISWPALPHDDPDYQYLHQLKKQTAMNNVAEDDEDEMQELSKERQKDIAQELRNKGAKLEEIAASPLIDYSKSWVGNHTDPADESGTN